MAAAVFPVGGVNLGAWPWLIASALGMALGVLTLCFNRIGNFSIYPRPRCGAILITGGPYRWIRHPMYSALMLMMLGIAGYNGHPSNVAGAVLVALAVIAKADVEERLLLSVFANYASYRARTRRFVPFVV